MADLLFEIGAEEIPAGFVPPALKQLCDDLTRLLAEARLAHGEVKAVGTPRRLAVWARAVAAKQADARTEALGPSVAAAFDAGGQPTQAALGFARSQGVEVAALERVETPKGLRLAVTKVEQGRKAEQVLPELLTRLVGGLKFRKAMRSRHDEVTFARPVRWLTALYGGKPVKVRFGEVASGKATSGHRFMAPKAIALKGTPEDYLAKLEKAFVMADPVVRKAAVEKGLAAAAKKAGGVVRPDPSLVEQVTYLVEHPTAIMGEFEASNLALPPEVVVTEMRNHQRYFAVVDGAGKLTNRFIAVSGTPVKDPKVARHGYERVLRARLADARFFFEEDRKRTLESRVADLGRRTYQAKLGTELQRVERIRAVAEALAQAAGRPGGEALALAARLCKADLGTGMVGEFPELQGIMGGHYARLEGLPADVADALEDHYKPVGATEEIRAATWARWSAWPIGSTSWWASSGWARRPPARPIPTACAAPPSASCGCCSTAATTSRCAPRWRPPWGRWPACGWRPSRRWWPTRCSTSCAGGSRRSGARSWTPTWWRRCCRPASTTWWTRASGCRRWRW